MTWRSERQGRSLARLARIARDERGAILPLASLFLVSLLGLSFLMVDLSRYLNLQSQMQKAADGFALAAAAELDGGPAIGGKGDAISRANKAIDAMLASRNTSVWGDTAPVTVASRTYLTALPPTDATGSTAGFATGDPTKAKYVEVIVAPASMGFFFSARILGVGVDNLSTNAVAVAGQTEAVCRFTPVYICNPMEGSGTSIWEAASDPTFRRRELTLKQGPQSASSCPGNFGFLSVGNNGAAALREGLAAINPGACYSKESVTTQPGNIASASDALNTRFALYERSASSMKSAAYPPATNVRKGYYNSGGGCNPTKWLPPSGIEPVTCPDTATCPFRGFTPDFVTDATTLCGGKIGNGLWDIEGYWLANHSLAGRARPAGWTNANPPSRQEVYQYEIDQGWVADQSAGINPPPPPKRDPEVGVPSAACNGPGIATPDRRTIYGAVINCVANADKFNGRASDLPIEAFAKFFLTRPAGGDKCGGGCDEIYAEISAIARPGDASGVVHDLVQLYR